MATMICAMCNFDTTFGSLWDNFETILDNYSESGDGDYHIYDGGDKGCEPIKQL